jgi:hypothetical protein
MSEYIYDENGKQLAWIESSDVFAEVGSKRKIATVRDGRLYSLRGEPLDLFLRGTEVIGLDGNAGTHGEIQEALRDRMKAPGLAIAPDPAAPAASFPQELSDRRRPPKSRPFILGGSTLLSWPDIKPSNTDFRAQSTEPNLKIGSLEHSTR